MHTAMQDSIRNDEKTTITNEADGDNCELEQRRQYIATSYQVIGKTNLSMSTTRETRHNSIRPTRNDSDEFDDDDDDENLDDSTITHLTCGLTMMSDDSASDNDGDDLRMIVMRTTIAASD